jgi:hypothetical protein
MSWANICDAVIAKIEALTPANTDDGGLEFAHVDGDQIEESAIDRQFAVRLSSEPARVGAVYTGSKRYATPFEISIRYMRGHSVRNDEVRIAQDAVQIVDALLCQLHADHSGFEQQGQGYATSNINEDEQRNYLVAVSMIALHN